MKKIDKYIFNFLYIVLIYFVIFIIVRVAIGHSFERDEAEQFLLNGIYKLGYSTQPPLYTWIQSIFFKLLPNPIMALALFKNMLLFGIYYLTYKTTFILSKDKIASIIATSSLLLIPALSWECQRDLTHTVLANFFVILLVYFIVKLREKDIKRLDYVILGTIIAFGILAKYNFTLLVLTILILSFFDAKLKNIIFKRDIIISIIVSLILLLPHFIWLLNHFNTATNATINKMKIGSSSNFIISIKVLFLALLELLAPYLLLFFIFFRKDISLNRNKFFKKYFIILTLVLVVLVLLLKMHYFKSRWILPLYLPIVIYMALSLKRINIKTVRYWLSLIIFIMVGFMVAYILRYTNPDFFKHPSRFNYPYSKINNYLNTHNIDYQLALYDSNLVGANLKLYKPNAKYKTINSKTIDEYKNRSNILILLDKDSFSYIPFIEKRGIKLKELKFTYKNSKKIYKVYIAYKKEINENN